MNAGGCGFRLPAIFLQRAASFLPPSLLYLFQQSIDVSIRQMGKLPKGISHTVGSSFFHAKNAQPLVPANLSVITTFVPKDAKSLFRQEESVVTFVKNS